MDNSAENKEGRTEIEKVFALAGAKNLHELLYFYNTEDQRLMHAGSWDYENSELIINKIKDILESVDPVYLSAEEREGRQEILWLWYHHAISCAIWRHKDKEKARLYAGKALAHQPKNNPNRITRLFNLLLDGRVAEAEIWVAGTKDQTEKKTAAGLLQQYYDGKGFFESGK